MTEYVAEKQNKQGFVENGTSSLGVRKRLLSSHSGHPHLHHQYNGVEGDHGQDGVLKRGRHHKMPQTVLERVPVLGHVTSQGLGADGKVNARPLKYREQEKEEKEEELNRVQTNHLIHSVLCVFFFSVCFKL